MTIESRQYVTFGLGEELFGVEVSKTREILCLVPVTSVPQTPDYLLGVINLRGQVVPVVDLRCKLGLFQGGKTQDSCIIVMELEVDGELLTVGGLADSVREVLELIDNQIEPAPRLGMRLNTAYLQGVGKVGEQFVLLLDVARMFNDEELSVIQASGDVAVA